MSSRSLAAARSKRAGDSAPPVSGNRPITSIGSQAAFAKQMPNGMGYNMPPPPNNVRIAKSIQPPQPTHNQSPYNNQQNHNQNSLPFSKLSISDAVGLITLRLGRVEQWIIETEHENNESNNSNSNSNSNTGSNDGNKLIDNAIFNTILARLESLEKNTGASASSSSASSISSVSEEFAKLTEDVNKLSAQFVNMSNDVNKHTIELAKNTEQVFRFNRELVETKDILKTFMVKYDMFAQETTQNFNDYEIALSDLEKKIPTEMVEESNINLNIDEADDSSEKALDLKSQIKEELGNIDF